MTKYANKESERHAKFAKTNYLTKSVYIPRDQVAELEKYMKKCGYNSYSKFFIDAMREKLARAKK